MLKLLIQLALISYAAAANDVKGCIACAAGTIAFKTTKAGCATCTAVPNQAKTAVLSCSIKADNSGAEKSSLGKGGGTRECLEGFFFTAQAGSADATCVACGDPSCITCSGTGAGKCTGPQPGFYLDSGVPKACTAVTDCAKGHQTQTVAEMCPTASPKTAKPTKDISGVCTACASVAPAKSKFSLLSTNKGCATCPTVPDAAKGVTYECTEDTGKDTHEKGTLKVVAAASGDDAGLKCTPGFFYTEASGTTDAKCTACATNCHTCTSATDCTKPMPGFYIDSKAPIACTLVTDCASGSEATPVATACPTNSNKTAQITKANGCTACALVLPAKSKFSLLSTGKGCATCPTVADAAKGVTYECTEDTGKDTHEKGTLKVVAAASGDDAGRKCKPGFFYTQASGTTDAKCTACATNCKSCTSSTVCTDADTYFFLKSDAPVNCDTMTNELCKANETLKRACTKKPAPGGSSSIAQVSMLVAVVSVLFSF